MSKKKLLAGAILFIIGVLLNIFFLTRPNQYAPYQVKATLEIACDENGIVQLFYSKTGQFCEEESVIFMYDGNGENRTFETNLTSEISHIRLDFPDECHEVTVSKLSFSTSGKKMELTPQKVQTANLVHMENVEADGSGFCFTTTDQDASITFADDAFVLDEMVRSVGNAMSLMKKILSCILIDGVLLGILFFSKKFMQLPMELYHNRSLIWKLAKNDFKTRYAGSYLGIIWAFVQPVVTIIVYWLVFDKGLNAGSTLSREGIEVPFVLWLTAGLVPWFFFQEALMNGTNALLEYNYLVKKVVFKISILPIIKIVSALFVHLFFVFFVLILFACYGYYPDFYTLQVIYYSFCMFVLVLALCYTTCSIVIFFRDLSQILNIVLQVGTWATPIMWQISIIHNNVLLFIFKLNPMYYIIKGYRDSLIDKEWFFQDIYMTIYFWGVVAVVFAIGTIIFKRLKVHFADVL